jgi:acyl-homoserine lactone acylase PvdQ
MQHALHEHNLTVGWDLCTFLHALSKVFLLQCGSERGSSNPRNGGWNQTQRKHELLHFKTLQRRLTVPTANMWLEPSCPLLSEKGATAMRCQTITGPSTRSQLNFSKEREAHSRWLMLLGPMVVG